MRAFHITFQLFSKGTHPPDCRLDFSNCYGAVTTAGRPALCLCWMCFLASHGSSHQSEEWRAPRQQEEGQPPPRSEDFIRGNDLRYSIQTRVKLAGALAIKTGRLAFTMQSKDFVILGGGSFKENAAMRPSDAFEASIIERNPGV